MHLRFRCVYMPTGNGIAERCHWNVKRIAAKMGCSIQETVYWYNVAPKDDVSPLTAPANEIYTYEVRIRGVDPVPASLVLVQNKYHLEDLVWVKPPHYRSVSEFQDGQVTGVISPQSVVVNGVSRDVKDLRLRTNVIPTSEADGDESSVNGKWSWRMGPHDHPSDKAHAGDSYTFTTPLSRIRERCSERVTKQNGETTT